MAESKEKFPEVQGGGSLILAWQIKNKPVLVVGGGEVAAGRILNLLNADALVTVVCPAEGLNPEVRHRVAHKQVTHIDRKFEPSDLENLPSPDTSASPLGPPAMVLTAVDDPAASTQIWKLCKAARIPANIADVPPECDFYFGSVHRDGPLQIMFIGQALPVGVGDAIERVGLLRAKLRELSPDIEDGPNRMRWMIRVSDRYSWNEMSDLTDEDMDNLLSYYKPKKVPDIDVLKAMRGGGMSAEDIDVFDGSFGFAI
ncbi:siroheme synthase Met8 [Apiospora kogelbergensis]|uniref:siroheme synthase Met8 n=1 Tax=Apiospora kogelbergensis TaxID=1337665 RepID=UPI00312EF08D